MAFLKNLFKKKPGGSGIGNILRGVTNVVSNGALGNGNNMIPLGETKTMKELAASGTFAGQASTISADGTIQMLKPLDEVAVTSPPLRSVSAMKSSPGSTTPEKLGKWLEPLISKATAGTQIGADNKTLWIIGGGFAFLAVVMLASNNRR